VVASQEEEVAAKEDMAARTISVAVVTAVHRHVVAATSTTCRKGAAGAVGTTTTTTTIVRRHHGDERPLCQVCFKLGHTADRCWHGFDENYVPHAKLVAAAMNSYTIDTNWYTNIGATEHITGELEKLSLRNKYNGGD
jgi:hypothetical protein